MNNVIYLGLVSFFADISAEMVYPIIPLYLTAVFGATPTLVGVIEGVAESVASLLKVFSGYLTDKYQNKKKIAFLGYSTGIVYKLGLIFATSWVGILLSRVIDRVGKGFRTAPRDVMVSESAEAGKTGKAFGIHKSLDMAGAALGILISYFFLRNSISQDSYKRVFFLSLFPLFVALFLFRFIEEKRSEAPRCETIPFWENAKNLDGQLKLYLFVAFLFTLGNSSNAFLLLMAKNVGFSEADVILLYFLYHATVALFAIPFGKRSDTVGRKKILVLGYLIFSLVYFGFAFVRSRVPMIFLFVLYGFYTSMVTGVERAFISEIAPPELKGTMLGMHGTIVGLTLLPASVIAGSLWTAFGSKMPFLFGGSLALIAAVLLLLFMKNPTNPMNREVR